MAGAVRPSGTWLGALRVELSDCGSTNDVAMALAGIGAPHGTVVIARAQRQGRGRLGRTWYSPPGESLYLSLLLRPALPAAAIPPVTLAAGVAVAEAVAELGVAPRLKWPNDVLAAGGKLAGVLTETVSRGDRVEAAVVGVGVNVRTVEFPPELRGVATSLARELGRPIEVAVVEGAILSKLDDWLARFLAGGVDAIAPAWTRLSAIAGARVRVDLGGGRVFEGTARGLARDGGLDVEDDRGHHVHVVAGEVAVVDGAAPA